MRRIAMQTVTVLAGLALSACGNGSAQQAESRDDHNPADVTFAQAMIPHHQQAVEMADLAETRAAHPQVKALATSIEAAQDPEIKQMTSWLHGWGEPTAAAKSSGSHGSMGGPETDGMMTHADMAKLAGLSGKAFDRAFLTMMTAHHNGAIKMARTEQADGSYGPAIKLAADIITSQGTEVAFMADLLKQV